MGANVLAVLDRIGRGSGVSLAKVLQLDGVERMLDVGGGAGTNAIAFCREYPGLKATVFDLPSTLQVTERSIKEAGLEDRIAVMPGNFNTDSLGGRYDLVLLSDVLHYQDAQANAALVRKAFAHLTDAGRLVIKDRFLDPDRTSPAWTTAFCRAYSGQYGGRTVLHDPGGHGMDGPGRLCFRHGTGTARDCSGNQIRRGLNG